MFVLLKNKILKYYDFTVNRHRNLVTVNSIQSSPFIPSQILLWTEMLKKKPLLILAHPFNYSLLILYSDLVRIHHFNMEKLFSPSFILNIKNCKAASYSPQGDKLVIGTNGAVMIIDCYSYEFVKKIQILNFLSTLKK
jgi:hypothetical protein